MNFRIRCAPLEIEEVDANARIDRALEALALDQVAVLG